MTKKQRNRRRFKRFACAWRADGGAAAAAEAAARKKAADTKRAKQTSRSGGIVYNLTQSGRPVSLEGLRGGAGYRDGSQLDPSGGAALRALAVAKPGNARLAKSRSNWR